MEKKIQFTKNYTDLSTNKGFQFEFYCDRCGSGYRTRFKATATGKIADVLDAASSLLGGIFGSAADISERVNTAAWEKAHDEAFEAAMEELKPDFIQCPRCSGWVCRKGCWNSKKGLCKGCAPDLGVEKSAAQASKAVEGIWENAEASDEDKKLAEKDWQEDILASCPQCEAPLATAAKFCPECGANLKKDVFCSKCGVKLTPGAKFCVDCGQKVEK